MSSSEKYKTEIEQELKKIDFLEEIANRNILLDQLHEQIAQLAIDTDYKVDGAVLVIKSKTVGNVEIPISVST